MDVREALTPADKKHAILLALKTWPSKSATSLAQQIGCSDRYVLDIKSQVRTTSDLPSRVTGKDGKSYPAARARSYYDEQAKQRQRESGETFGRGKVQENLPEPKHQQARDAAGKAVGVSGKSVDFAA